MKNLKVKFVNDSIPDEARLVYFNAKSIELGLYQKAGFYVLPYLAPRNTNTVYFPDLNYSKGFWKTIRNTSKWKYASKVPESIQEELESKLSSYKIECSITVKRIKEDWRKIEPQVSLLIKKDFNQGLAVVNSIEVLPTNYGTLGSFNPYKSKSGYNIKLSHRIDIPADYIANTILLSLYRIDSSKIALTGNTGWHERQASVKYLLKQERYKKLLVNINGKESINPKDEAKLSKDSKIYLTKLGFPETEVVTIKDGKLCINSSVANGSLTPQEEVLLKLLTQNKFETVSYDAIAEAIWKEDTDEKYSLYSISKLVEGLRFKLVNLGVNRKIIKSARGRGYLLVE